ncbi:MAG: 4Fe-4S binding protein [Candidatus Nezhaarchaeales archaeon]
MVKIVVDESLCKGCGICVDLCPAKVLELSKDISVKGVHLPIPTRSDRCTKCLLCVMYCPDFAITVGG